MTIKRSFNAGRQSELLYNEELADVFESIKHLLEVPAGKNAIPHPSLHGAIWWDSKKNELNYYDKKHDKMINIFKGKFQLIDQLLSTLPPGDPVYGQLWLNNGVLYYFDGTNWAPVKALDIDASQLNQAVFENFVILSPIIGTGNSVIDDATYSQQVEYYKREALEDKLDVLNNSRISEVDNYAIGDKLFDTELTVPLLTDEAKSQFLVVNANVDRLFLDNDLSDTYETVNDICVQYKKKEIAGKRQTLIHVNPGKMTAMKKRMLKIDRLNPIFYMDTEDTEFYGFKAGSIKGDFLKPYRNNADSDSLGDYTFIEGGISLSYNASQNYDYILAVTFEFSWIRSNGKLTKTTSNDETSSYYIPKAVAPLNLFVDGYDLESKYWNYDGLSQVLTIKEDTSENDVSLWHTLKNEYGWVKQYTIDNRGIIKTVTNFKMPLIFVNGQAFAPTAKDVEINGKEIYVNGAKRDMCWGIVELFDDKIGKSIMCSTGIVDTVRADGTPIIFYDPNDITDEQGIILFVNGLIVKTEDIVRDTINHAVTVNGLKADDEYIILVDTNNNMFKDEDLSAAMYTGRNDESLVYMNNKLICNSTSVVTTRLEEEVELTAANNEIRGFVGINGADIIVKYKIYDYANEVWNELEAADEKEIKNICFSYDNTTSSIKINIPYTKSDKFDIFAYGFTNTVENPLIIRNTWIHDDTEITADSPFECGTGALSVWLDGIRQYHIKEWSDGTGFSFPKKVSGKVTYIIEKAETGHSMACEREILTFKDIVGDTPNVYKTALSLYPGRVTVYVSGLRVPKNSWTILDNNTIMFKDTKKKLIGNSETYPNFTFMREDGNITTIETNTPAEILIEVRQEFKRVEGTIDWEEPNEQEIIVEKHEELTLDILEAADEILIFINGCYTGLTNNSGYYKNKAKGSIQFLVSSAISFLNEDPLYNLLVEDQQRRINFKEKHGYDYARKVKNTITLEWR